MAEEKEEKKGKGYSAFRGALSALAGYIGYSLFPTVGLLSHAVVAGGSACLTTIVERLFGSKEEYARDMFGDFGTHLFGRIVGNLVNPYAYAPVFDFARPFRYRPLRYARPLRYYRHF